MAPRSLKSRVIRILKDEELSGYSVYKLLVTKGEKIWPNHVYTMLVQMEKEGLLKSRWKGEEGGTRRKHLYSLSAAGRVEYEDIVKDSLSILMERFFKENLSFEDLSFHMGLVKEMEDYGGPRRWSKKEPFRLVVASPAYHPLICFPKFYYALSEAYPSSTIYVVKNPWEKSLEGRKNLAFLDGSRDDLPLRDRFADYILLQGFPKSSSINATISECMRVLKDDGHLFVEIPSILVANEEATHDTIFPQFVLTQFYELFGEDRVTRIEDVIKALSSYFERIKRVEVRGKVIIYGEKKQGSYSARPESEFSVPKSWRYSEAEPHLR